MRERPILFSGEMVRATVTVTVTGGTTIGWLTGHLGAGARW